MSAQAALFPKQSSAIVLHSGAISTRIDAFRSFPYQELPYCKRNWGHGNHSICSYQGKLKPAIAHFLVSTFTTPGQTVLDPFSGVGTIPFEACLQGRRGIGLDLNPIAFHSTVAKTHTLQAARIWNAFDELAEFVDTNSATDLDFKSAQLTNINGDLSEYYNEKTFREILLARRFYQDNEFRGPEYSFIFACLFHILHGNRPYALSRRSHPLTPFKPSGPFEYRSLRLKLKAKVSRVLHNGSSDSFCEGGAFLGSVFQLSEIISREHLHPVDAIVTSPPFLNSTRFYMANWIRFWFAGWEAQDFRGSRRDEYLETKQTKDINVYRDVFAQFFSVIKDGGLAILHLGVVGSRDMGESLSPFAKEAGFQILDLVYEDVEGHEKHGVRDQGSTSKHQFLFLRKPANP